MKKRYEILSLISLGLVVQGLNGMAGGAAHRVDVRGDQGVREFGDNGRTAVNPADGAAQVRIWDQSHASKSLELGKLQASITPINGSGVRLFNLLKAWVKKKPETSEKLNTPLTQRAKNALSSAGRGISASGKATSKAIGKGLAAMGRGATAVKRALTPSAATKARIKNLFTRNKPAKKTEFEGYINPTFDANFADSVHPSIEVSNPIYAKVRNFDNGTYEEPKRMNEDFYQEPDFGPVVPDRPSLKRSDSASSNGSRENVGGIEFKRKNGDISVYGDYLTVEKQQVENAIDKRVEEQTQEIANRKPIYSISDRQKVQVPRTPPSRPAPQIGRIISETPFGETVVLRTVPKDFEKTLSNPRLEFMDKLRTLKPTTESRLPSPVFE